MTILDDKGINLLGRLRERFAQVAETIATQARCTVEPYEARNDFGWYDGRASIPNRHIKAPPLEAATSVEDLVQRMLVRLHETGHIVAGTDHPAGKIYRETVVDLWALRAWDLNKLPYYDMACYYAGRALGTELRSELAAGKTTLEEIGSFVPSELLRYAGELREPTYLHEMTEAQLRRKMKDDPQVGRMITRLKEWAG